MISHVISAWSAMGHCMISHMISECTVTWSVYEQLHYQCMISHVISTCMVRWSVYDQLRLQCMISAWSGTWRVHNQWRDQCMHRHVISVWSASWSVHDQPREAGRYSGYELDLEIWKDLKKETARDLGKGMIDPLGVVRGMNGHLPP